MGARHGGARFDSAGRVWQGARLIDYGAKSAGHAFARYPRAIWRPSDRLGVTTVVKAEWGTKRACPKCNTRFYDLTIAEPVTCIACGHAWVPEPILKSKQPLPFEQAKPELVKKDDDLAGDDEDIDTGEDEEPSPDDEVDLGGDDDLGVEAPQSEDEH